METEKWTNVLIEWVNCLKLSKPIETIDDLRNGLFFNNIKKLINKSTSTDTDILTFIFKVFGEHYPKYSITDKSNIHLNDLPRCDLNSITSLLMHFTCIYDRRDVLTSPLCHSLTNSTQVSIRNFLQKIHKNITNDELNIIVKDCINLNENTGVWFSGDNSPENSPLLHILKTPASKIGRLQKRDKEIGRLKSELELERYEKTDLQEELRTLNDKNKKLEKMLEQKTCEVSRLRSEVVALENRTPPHYQDIDSREIQKRLKCEIQTLEQYVQQCDMELDKLKEEKDSFKDMVRNLENQCNLWQSQFIESESKLNKIQENANEQESTLQFYKSHCTELEDLLAEYRSKPLDRTIEESFASPTRTVNPIPLSPSLDNLAHSVVEVQLRDIQKQNNQLNIVIKENQLKIVNLEENLKTTKKRLESAFAENITFSEKVTDLEFELLEFHNANEQLTEEVKILNTDKTELNEEIEKYKDIKIELEMNCNSIEKELNDRMQEIIEKNKTVEDLQEQISGLAELKHSLQEENSKLSEEIKKLSEDNKKITSELDDVTARFKEVNNEKLNLIQVCDEMKQDLEIVNLEKEKLNNSNGKLLNENRDLKLHAEETVQELQQYKDNFKILNESLKKKEDDIKNLEENMSELTIKLNAVLTENQNLLTDINEMKEDLESTKRVLQLEEEKNLKLGIEIDEKNKTNADLIKHLNDVQQDVETEKTKYSELEQQHFNNEQEIINLKTINVELEKEVIKSNSMKENLEIELKSSENLYKEAIEDCSVKVVEADKKIKDISDKLELVSNHRNEVVKENSELKKEVESMSLEKRTLGSLNENLHKVIAEKELKLKDSEIVLAEVTKKFIDLQGLNDDLSLKLENSSIDLNNLQDDFKKLSNEKEILSKTINSYEDNLQQATKKLECYLEENSTLVDRCTELEKIISDKCRNIEELKGENKILNDNLKNLIEEKNLITEEVKDLKVSLEILNLNVKEDKNRNLELEKTVIEKNSVINNLNEQMEELSKLNNELNQQNVQNIEKFEQDLQKVNEEKNNALQEKEVVEENYRAEIKKASIQIMENEKNANELQSILSALKDVNSNLKTDFSLLEKVNQSQKQNLSVLQNQFDELQVEKTRIEQSHVNISEEFRKVKSQLVETNEYNSVLLEKCKTFNETIEQESSELENVKQINLHLNEKNENNLREIEEFKGRIKELSEEKNELTKNILNLLEVVREKEKIIDEYKTDLDLRRRTITDLENKNSELTKELENVKLDHQEVTDTFKDDVNKITAFKNELTIEKLNLENKLDELKQSISQYENQIITANNEKIDSLTLINDYVNKIDEANQKIKETDIKLQTVQTHEHELIEEKIKLNQIITELKINLEELSKSQNDVIRNYQLKMDEATEKINDTELNLQTISKEKNDIVSENCKLMKKINECELLLQAATDSNKKLTDNFLLKIDEINATAINVKAELQVVSQQNHNLNEENSLLKEQLVQKEEMLNSQSNFAKDCQIKLNELNIKIEEQKLELENLFMLEAENVELNKKVNELNDALTKSNKENSDLTIKLESQISLFEDSKKKIDELEHNLEETKKLQNNASELLSENEILMETIKQKNEQLQLAEEKFSFDTTQLSTNLKILQSHKEDLEKEVEFYRLELEKSKKERNEIIESQTKVIKETENNIVRAHEADVAIKNDLLARIKLLENEKQEEVHQRKTLENELQKVRKSFDNTMSENSKLERKAIALRKIIEEKSAEMNDYSHVKEAYEKLLEENNKFMTEIDTIKYKKCKDRDEFVRLLKKEREDCEQRENKRVREVRGEYEMKLEKMKDKMLKLYRDELSKEMGRVKSNQHGSDFLQKANEDLRNALFDAEQKINMLEMKLELSRARETQQAMYLSRESLHSLGEESRSSMALKRPRDMSATIRDSFEPRSRNPPSILDTQRRDRMMSNTTTKKETMRKASTLPRQTAGMNLYEETVTTTTKRTSLLPISSNIGQNLQMEDEEENMFSEKYLTDLKEGRCNVPSITGRESNTRFSELAWRNSLVPAHLKSSYPAETQFVSPSQFKEDDLKSGAIDLDDSLSKLLPGEKTRHRKDFGTTSYKKPGPPTPSKNGGRSSLQNNEVHPLREHNVETKKITPSRIKNLFRRNATTRENTENQSTTPRTRRLSNILRKPK